MSVLWGSICEEVSPILAAARRDAGERSPNIGGVGDPFDAAGPVAYWFRDVFSTIVEGRR